LGLCRLHGHVDYFSKTQDEAAPQEPQATVRGCRWSIAAHGTAASCSIAHPTATNGAQQSCWRVQVKPRGLPGVAVTGGAIGAGACPRPNNARGCRKTLKSKKRVPITPLFSRDVFP